MGCNTSQTTRCAFFSLKFFYFIVFFSLTRRVKELNNFLQEIEEKIKEADKAFPDTVQ